MAEDGHFHLLLPIATATGLPIDQINFLVCQLVALLCGYPYRIILGPEKTSPTVRHAVQLLIGVPLTLFCFGSQISHLVIQSAICLALMRFCKPGVMEKGVFVFAIGYLCVCHIYRMYYDYGGYTLDITGSGGSDWQGLLKYKPRQTAGLKADQDYVVEQFDDLFDPPFKLK